MDTNLHNIGTDSRELYDCTEYKIDSNNKN